MGANTLNIFRNPPVLRVLELLRSASLPADDITPALLADFFGCGPELAPDGVVGIEVYGTVALLRSLVVAEKRRGAGCGQALAAEAERHARSRGARELYLLTTTAERFFERLSYARTSKENAPEAIRRSKEFSELCPSTSVLMVKPLTGHPNHRGAIHA